MCLEKDRSVKSNYLEKDRFNDCEVAEAVVVSVVELVGGDEVPDVQTLNVFR
jgi:hypothetical protein